MKNLILLIVIYFLALFFNNAFAKIWVVDSNPGNMAKDFTTLQAANDDANVQSGDTLYVSGCAIGYGQLTATKQLHIIGPGYFLNQNDSTQANKNEAMMGKLIFQNGSAGSTITGCNISRLEILVQNIVINRNKISTGSYNVAIWVDTQTNIKIAQNYISTYHGESIYINGISANLIINNNFMYRGWGGVGIRCNTSTNIAIENNIFNNCGLELNNAVITNNTLTGSYSGSNNIVQHNICNYTQFPASGNNQQNVNMNTVFVGSGSTDGQWQLAPGSPAIGTGTNGTDIGMFGGNDPYVLSGISSIPAIYEFLGSSAVSQTFPVQVKIKSRR